MSGMSIDQVLAQIRTLSAQASPNSMNATQTLSNLAGLAGDGVAGVTGTGNSTPSTPAFGTLLKQAIDSVNSTQQSADALSSAWERGAPGVDLASVMVETQKASVSFQALAQVRNRLISAYQDIMNMSI
jgi:flagellar hook-basal body complex protein FliE